MCARDLTDIYTYTPEVYISQTPCTHGISVTYIPIKSTI